MERGNTKHGPRLDDEMEQEVRGVVPGGVDSRAEDWRGLEHERAGAPPGMTPEEVDERSRLGRYIPLSALPGTRDEFIAAARGMEAPDDIVAALERLPEGQSYETVSQIWAALGHHNEARRT